MTCKPKRLLSFGGRAEKIASFVVLPPRTDAIVPAMADTATYSFRCPNCEAQYKVVRVETAATHSIQLTCLSCGAPLNNREGGYALKYFRVSDGAEPGRKNGRRSKF